MTNINEILNKMIIIHRKYKYIDNYAIYMTDLTKALMIELEKNESGIIFWNNKNV